MKYFSCGRLCRNALALILCCLLLFRMTFPAISAQLSPSAEAALLMDWESGEVLYEKNAHIRRGMASTTKIMTALVVAELLPMDKQIAVPREAVNIEGSSIYLTEGELLTVEQLLYALLLSSANDAATALAIAASGSVESFAEKMNKKAGELGLVSTHFTNPHGLHHEEHYTTAYELALISRAALKNATVARIVGTYKHTIPQGVTPQCAEGAGLRYLVNHNKLLMRYEGAIGMKTGFTKASGRCLVSAARREGLTLIAVTLNAPDDWRDHTAMLDFGFEHYGRVTVYEAGEFRLSYPVCGGTESYVTLTNSAPIILTLPKGSSSTQEHITAPRRFELAPIKAGRHMAELTVVSEGRTASSPLVSAYAINKKQ